MSHLHQVVDFGSFANHGAAEACSVDGRVGTDFDVIPDGDCPHLGNFLVFSRREFVAKAVGAYDNSGMKSHSRAEGAFGGHADPRHQPAIGADLGGAPDENLGLKMGSFPDHSPGFNHAKWTNGGAGSDYGTGGDYRARVYSGKRFRPESLFNAGADLGQGHGGILDEEKLLFGGGFTLEIEREEDD